MCKPALDTWDMRPQSMIAYLSNFGWHFNKPLCEYAISLMYYKEGDQEKSVDCLTKEKVKELLTKHGVEVKNLTYDFIYTYHMYCSDLKKVQCLDEKSKLLITKATVEDDDVADGFILRRWLATMTGNGVPIYWSDFLNDSE